MCEDVARERGEEGKLPRGHVEEINLLPRVKSRAAGSLLTRANGRLIQRACPRRLAILPSNRVAPTRYCQPLAVQAVCRRMPKQMEFWGEDGEFQTYGNRLVTELVESSHVESRLVIESNSTYTSIKRVFMVLEGSLDGRPKLTSTEAAKSFFREYWRVCPGNDQERFVVACLNTKHVPQCVVPVTVGTLDASLVHPREVFKPAIVEGSSAIILSHNHPSGDPTPSREDRLVTDRLTEVGEKLGIQVLDHIIHGDGTTEVISIREC